ncbi:hypothetical protein PYCC9005_005456 [Savitreella phatthalungensis]
MSIERAQRCISWASSRGATIENVRAGVIDGRGTCLVRVETEKDARIVIPADLLLSKDNIRAFAESQPGFKELLNEWSFKVPLTHKRTLLLFFAWDRRHGSPWSEYTAALPDKIDSPVWWDDDGRLLLVGTTVEGVAEDKRAFTAAWLRVQQARPEASALTKSISLDELLHYTLLIDSRALMSKEDDAVMVPVVDFANHSSGRPPAPGSQNSAWEHDRESGEFVLATLPNVGGQELLFSYGKRSAGELLLNYGFIEGNVGLDMVPSRCITLDLSGDGNNNISNYSREPSLRLHDDRPPLEDVESDYIWYAIAEHIPELDVDQALFAGKPYEDLRRVFAESSRWPVYRFLAAVRAQIAVTQQIKRLDETENDERLCDAAGRVPSDVLTTANRVRDAERAVLELNLSALDTMREELMDVPEVVDWMTRRASSDMRCDEERYKGLVHRVADIMTRHYVELPGARIQPTSSAIHEGVASVGEGKSAVGVEELVSHLERDILPALANYPGPRFFGFVTGGSTPAAQLADMIVTAADQHVQMHSPELSIATIVEDAALCRVLELLKLQSSEWPGRICTTGATASNILGLACARNAVLGRDVGEYGFDGRSVRVIAAGAHASLRKAASIVGIGRRHCIECTNDDYNIAFDLDRLDSMLADNKTKSIGSIVVASFGEVNTGLFTPEMEKVKRLCERHGAWLHIDAAFAVFAGLCAPMEMLLRGLEYADSITCDAHKWLNVPYDCGLFFTKDLNVLKDVCSGGDSPYLSSSIADREDGLPSLPSPMAIGLENSRRFRALPLYANLVAYGKDGLAEMVKRNLMFARQIDLFLRTDFTASAFYEVLTPPADRPLGHRTQRREHEMTNIVLFTPKQSTKVDVDQFVGKINAQGLCYVTPTTFNGRRCIRIAVSNWRTGIDGDGDLQLTKRALMEAI